MDVWGCKPGKFYYKAPKYINQLKIFHEATLYNSQNKGGCQKTEYRNE